LFCFIRAGSENAEGKEGKGRGASGRRANPLCSLAVVVVAGVPRGGAAQAAALGGHGVARHGGGGGGGGLLRGVAAVQVGFEIEICKTKGDHIFHISGSRVETRAPFKLWVNCIQLVQPHRVLVLALLLLLLLPGIVRKLYLAVAVQVNLKANFETRISTFQFQGFESRRFQAMGKRNSTLYSCNVYTPALPGLPPRGALRAAAAGSRLAASSLVKCAFMLSLMPSSAPGVALQVAFERQTLKPIFHLIGYRLWV
jgi:hypothetical protein